MQIRIVISFIFCLAVSMLHAQKDTVQQIIKGRKNSLAQQQKPYVILISSDGFRYDYANKYNAKNLLSLASTGIRAASMIPSFPTLTFPNHYSIATGLYPAHHGLVDNAYYDRGREDMYTMYNQKIVTDGSRYSGVPLWVLAEQQQMLTASFYWVGTEAPIKGIFPTYYYKYNEIIPIERRIQVVVDWLSLPSEVRPHFITFYFPEVDHAGHDYGPGSMQTERSVQFVDASVQKLYDAVKTTGLPVSYIFLSDHGMTNVDTLNFIPTPPVIDTNLFISNRGSQFRQLYAKNLNDIKPLYKKLKKDESAYKVYLKKDIPKRLHYRTSDDYFNKTGDIFLMARWPRVFSMAGRHIDPGAHGFDPYRIKDMHAVFYAWGHLFKTNLDIPSFENIHVYPLIAEMLGLSITEKIDGNTKLARRILK